MMMTVDEPMEQDVATITVDQIQQQVQHQDAIRQKQETLAPNFPQWNNRLAMRSNL